MGQSLVQRTPTDCGACVQVCDLANLVNVEALSQWRTVVQNNSHHYYMQTIIIYENNKKLIKLSPSEPEHQFASHLFHLEISFLLGSCSGCRNWC
jgi:predicted molibdopterin-dependent oxidoreductase YjgC